MTLMLHVAHGNSILSVHTLLVAVPGALVVMLIGGSLALIGFGIGRALRWKSNFAYLSWFVSIAVVGIALIVGAQPDI